LIPAVGASPPVIFFPEYGLDGVFPGPIFPLFDSFELNLFPILFVYTGEDIGLRRMKMKSKCEG